MMGDGTEKTRSETLFERILQTTFFFFCGSISIWHEDNTSLQLVSITQIALSVDIQAAHNIVTQPLQLNDSNQSNRIVAIRLNIPSKNRTSDSKITASTTFFPPIFDNNFTPSISFFFFNFLFVLSINHEYKVVSELGVIQLLIQFVFLFCLFFRCHKQCI